LSSVEKDKLNCIKKDGFLKISNSIQKTYLINSGVGNVAKGATRKSQSFDGIVQLIERHVFQFEQKIGIRS